MTSTYPSLYPECSHSCAPVPPFYERGLGGPWSPLPHSPPGGPVFARCQQLRDYCPARVIMLTVTQVIFLTTRG